MSRQKDIKLSERQIAELIRLRRLGYSWVELGWYFERDHTTIIYHWRKNTNNSPSKTVEGLPVLALKKRKPKTALPSTWNGDQHSCCNSFLKNYHFPNCTRDLSKPVEETPFETRRVIKNKYDHFLYEPIKQGKSYQQYKQRQ